MSSTTLDSNTQSTRIKNQFQDNDMRAKRYYVSFFVNISIWILFFIFAIIFGFTFFITFSNASYDSDTSFEALGGMFLVFLILLIILVLGLVVVNVFNLVFYLMWLHRAHQNAEYLGKKELFLSPGWNVGFYFIPLANLVIPYLLLLGIDKLSAKNYAQALIITFWVLLGISYFSGFFGNLADILTQPYLFSYGNNSTSDNLDFRLIGASFIFSLISQVSGSITSIIQFFIVRQINKGQKAMNESYE